jgi:hypothetical protein
LVDEDGLALRSCSWIWVRNRETRGCIGCHEDGERTPDNRFVKALAKPSIPLTLPPEKRRTVDFRRDVQPILDARCNTAACHGSADSAMDLRGSRSDNGIPQVDPAYTALLEGFSADSPAGNLVHPGRARTSPLIWRLYGRNTSRPWDGGGDATPKTVAAHPESPPLTADEKQTLAEWIDLGAPWDGIPASDPPGRDEARGGDR